MFIALGTHVLGFLGEVTSSDWALALFGTTRPRTSPTRSALSVKKQSSKETNEGVSSPIEATRDTSSDVLLHLKQGCSEAMRAETGRHDDPSP